MKQDLARLPLLLLGFAALAATHAPARAADDPAKVRTQIRCENWTQLEDGRWTPKPQASMSTEDFAESTLLPGGTRVMGAKLGAQISQRCAAK